MTSVSADGLFQYIDAKDLTIPSGLDVTNYVTDSQVKAVNTAISRKNPHDPITESLYYTNTNGHPVVFTGVQRGGGSIEVQRVLSKKAITNTLKGKSKQSKKDIKTSDNKDNRTRDGSRDRTKDNRTRDGSRDRTKDNRTRDGSRDRTKDNRTRDGSRDGKRGGNIPSVANLPNNNDIIKGIVDELLSRRK